MVLAPHKDLALYKMKRDFSKTSEPPGPSIGRTGLPIFVIQEHDASHLHYDLRLEVGGVLKSWAVPKGPSNDPEVKRMAIMTEDHPLDYAEFEGTIPKAEYGGGTVMVWDKGVYLNIREGKKVPIDMARSIEEGTIEVWLIGEKLRGGYVLFRTGYGKKGNAWILKKMRDAEAGGDFSIDPDRSAKTGRTMEEIENEKNQTLESGAFR